jgi:hypothetical protein
MRNPYEPPSTYGAQLPEWFTRQLETERDAIRRAFGVMLRNAKNAQNVTVNGQVRNIQEVLQEALTLPYGVIVMFSGTLAEARTLKKYELRVCDGSMGTPNLEHCFIRGAGPQENSGDEGGATTHDHVTTQTVIDTDVNDAGVATDGGTGAGLTVAKHTHLHEVTIPALATDEVGHLPTYYELIFLMKKKG